MSDLTDQTDDLVEAIKPLIGGTGPIVQGAVLADLTAIWLAGHDASIRARILEVQIDSIRKLTDLHAKRMGR